MNGDKESLRPNGRLSHSEAMYNHLVLPPQLPQREDHNIVDIETDMIDRLIASSHNMRDLPENELRSTWDAIYRSLRASKDVNFKGKVDRSALNRELRTLGESHFLVVYVGCQNSALYIYRANDSVLGPSVIFEAFEASARNEDVMATENALQWDFPGSAVAIPMSRFLEQGFIHNLATFLEHASREAVKNFAAYAFKAGTTVFEYRNTPEPSLISSFLMAILQENGRTLTPTLLRKMVRDDVLWDNADKPWRRSPYWLIMRVAIARYLSQQLGGEIGRAEYKFLMAHLFANFLASFPGTDQSVERLDILRRKFCRRLVKLEVDKHHSPMSQLTSRIDYLFAQLDALFQGAVRKAMALINASWSKQQLVMSKTIPDLPRQASPEDLLLELRVSGGYLNGVLTGFKRPRRRDIHNRSTISLAEVAKQHLNSLSQSHFELMRMESMYHCFCHSQPVLSPEEICSHVCDLIADYLRKAPSLYEGKSELKSLMILHVMELWVKMDEAACFIFPLLRDFHPVFQPHMLDRLLIPQFQDMKRVQNIQSYLQQRVSKCGHAKLSIFVDPEKECIGCRWYEESADSFKMKRLHECIEEWASQRRDQKATEWKQKMEEYTRLSKSIDQSSCVYRQDDMNPLGRGIHDERECPRCQMVRRQGRICIQAYEHPLPTDAVVAKAVIFELACPRILAIYRESTWQVLARLGFAKPIEGIKPKCCLGDYEQLRAFSSGVSSFSLASTTKSFLTTHYSWMHFPVEWESGRDGVCRPNGLRLAYYDKESKSWSGRLPCQPTFSQHTKLIIPSSSPFSKLTQDVASQDKPYGPSSYEVMATALNCPLGINVHEYLAFQAISSGTSRRWLTILVEFGSSNLNFSNEATMLLMGHLAVQCGPATDSEDPFRVIHRVFRDQSFCLKLAEQINKRLDSVSSNWRETHLMETLITLALRIIEFALAADDQYVLAEAQRVLDQARGTCARWFKLLRAETYKVTDSESAQHCQKYALWAALLCKRTFQPQLSEMQEWDAAALQIFIQSSITVQDNLVVELESLPQTLQHAVIRDLRMSFQLRGIVSKCITTMVGAFRTSLRDIWPEEKGSPRQLSDVRLEDDYWISCISSTDTCERETVEQQVYYNFVEGVLLVDGCLIGKLPKDPKHSLTLNELFGNQALLTYPSHRPRMQYTLCVQPFGFQVHVGYDDVGELIVRAFRPRFSLQLIHRDYFRKGDDWDLPGPLLDDKFHWLNLQNGLLYITDRQRPWPGDGFRGFILDVNKRTCSRTQLRKGRQIYDQVVCPYRPLFIRTSRILDSFEFRRHILVMQPGGGRHLVVELRRLNILFYVNNQNRLQSPQLQCEVDPNQDAGTWYGLRSKLVCRNLKSPSDRSVLVPLGKLVVEPQGCHVLVKVEPNGSYGRYTINATLGRLDCAAEPLLVYTKALLHAFTSFLLPDPLTGRTGTEEAIQWLQSGICQPWCPLGPAVTDKLEIISRLTPARYYYPRDLKSMRTDHWLEGIPARLQSSMFRPTVDRILKISESLRVFTPNNSRRPELPPLGEMHLHTRALARQQVLERYLVEERERYSPKVQAYLPRDRLSSSNIRHRNVLEVTNILRKWPRSIETAIQLPQLLAAGSVVGGFRAAFDKPSLNDRINSNILQNWGSLVQFARETTNKYDLMFLFGLISFRLDVDMSLIRTLISFAIFDELQSIKLPPWDEFLHFQPDQAPQLDYLLHLLEPFQSKQPENDTDIFGQFSGVKQRKKLQLEKLKYKSNVHEDSQYFANFLLDQWPCLEPNIQGLTRSLLLDVGSAVEAIRPEWRRLYQNLDLARHLQQVQSVLSGRHSEKKYDPAQWIISEDIFPTRTRGDESIDLGKLLQKSILDSDASGHSRNGDGKMMPETWKENARRPLGELMQNGTNHFPESTKPSPIFPGLDNLQKSLLPMKTHFHKNAQTAAPMLVLDEIAERLSVSQSSVKQRYAEDFRQSLMALRSAKPSVRSTEAIMQNRTMEITDRRAKVDSIFQLIQKSLDQDIPVGSSRQIKWLKAGGIWPAVTKRTVLEQLSTSIGTQLFGTGMRGALIELGISITNLQREIRLNLFQIKGESGRYNDEIENQGHSNWKPAEYPDWLLLEIESNLMIRPVQVDVAQATISPVSGGNSVLQMNMGQGKTSCIIPMVAVALANKRQLVRVLVPKALLQQTAQLLQARLGEMLGRTLRHVPFSRRTPTTEANILAFGTLHRDMLQSGGIMICQPEHNMSFMLSGYQRLLDNRIEQAGQMIKVQSWITRVSRDILDESDYTLAVRTQLIYPSGSQMTVDGHPHRWQVSQAILRLVNEHTLGLSYDFPQSIDVVRRPGGGFPLIYFLRHDVEDEIVRRITADIYRGLEGILPINTNALQPADRVAIKDFISAAKPRSASVERIRKLCPDRPSIPQTVYLLRGLLVNRILMMTLKKRWNVEYGLHPNRDPIAVPFHAKGVPSEQSEWGHPDVAILFTCLAFYYDGINLSQLRQCLEHVLKSDDPSTEYDRWTSAEDFPPSLRAWNSINVGDELQLSEIWKVVRYNGVVIDYYLNNFVFPRHAKQFKVKLQSNGWDIPLFSTTDDSTEVKESKFKPLTTGFSGTNDNRTMLPLNIKQKDLPSLLHTNAEVLTYLLHQRNRKCVLPRELRKDKPIERASEVDLLHGMRQRKIRVLIDAGAQILEMDNLTLAKEWLKIDGEALAALYFDEGNKPWVVTKQGKKTPLIASPFADDLSQCLVYLDEAHTRGTDLKLPPKCRGALTLRLGQTKDHTVQAAMRLRQLGTTQSISFFISPEVHQSIADLHNKTVQEHVDSADVIEWLLENTCDGLEQLQPLYYSQGSDYCRRIQSVLDNPNFLSDKTQRQRLTDTIKQDEQQSLQHLYEPKVKNRPVGVQTTTNAKLSGYIGELNKRRKAFQDTGRAVHGSALQEVEQEREVAFEVESVRQVKKPQQYPAHSFPGLHPQLESFARTGRLPADAHCFTHILHSLSKTMIGRKFRISRAASESKLFVTTEFDRTVKVNVDLSIDNFIRPVNWLLWSPATETAVVIIPEEAEALIAILRRQASPAATHLLTYAAPTTRKMLHFNNFKFYSIPSLPDDWSAPKWLRIELGLYGGGLYIGWSDYEPLCSLLGIDEGVGLRDETDISLVLDGSADDESNDEAITVPNEQEGRQKLTKKPLTFIQDWLAVRRRGQDFSHSPMGFISQGKSLQPDHAFFNVAKETKSGHQAVFAPLSRQAQDEDHYYEEYDGVDDMGANEAVIGDAQDDDIIYDTSEYTHAGKTNRRNSDSGSEQNGCFG